MLNQFLTIVQNDQSKKQNRKKLSMRNPSIGTIAEKQKKHSINHGVKYKLKKTYQ